MIKAGIIGATGYAGAEIARILACHREAEVVWYGSRSYIDKPYSEVYGNMYNIADDACKEEDLEVLMKEADVIFTATPQGKCSTIMSEELLSNAKVIDISAAFRIKDVAKYEEWYGLKHGSPEFIDEAVYGLCELARDEIRGARLIANPGCYPTCSILSIYPALAAGIIDPDSIIIDAKSGTTGAGRGAKVANLFCEVNENIKAYSVPGHRHTPEIEDQLAKACGRELHINFTPHLVPMERGILVTAYANLASEVSDSEIRDIYEKFYANEHFVRVLPEGRLPETRNVRCSNYADIAFKTDRRTGRLIMMGAIDNLVKGAAGQAVQNMNIMFGIDEKEGIDLIPSSF